MIDWGDECMKMIVAGDVKGWEGECEKQRWGVGFWGEIGNGGWSIEKGGGERKGRLSWVWEFLYFNKGREGTKEDGGVGVI